MITDDELTAIMERINGPLYPRVHAIAARYTKRRLPEGDTQNTQARIASLFGHACRDFLIRDSAERAEQYRDDAAALEKALRVLRRDDRRYFDSLMADGVTVDAPVGEPGPVRIVSRCGNRAVAAIEEMAKRFHEIAQDYDKDTRHNVFYYCLGRVFAAANVPVPAPANAEAALLLLIEAMEGVVSISGLETGHTSQAIRRRLKAGAAA
jgi:hypothetical protein